MACNTSMLSNAKSPLTNKFKENIIYSPIIPRGHRQAQAGRNPPHKDCVTLFWPSLASASCTPFECNSFVCTFPGKRDVTWMGEARHRCHSLGIHSPLLANQCSSLVALSRNSREPFDRIYCTYLSPPCAPTFRIALHSSMKLVLVSFMPECNMAMAALRVLSSCQILRFAMWISISSSPA
jgi:hypothetical protein